MPTSINRRSLVISAVAVATGAAAASPSTPLNRWAIGYWKSDAELSVRNWYFQGQHQLNDNQRDRLRELFGHLEYRIDRTVLTVIEKGRKRSWPYRVSSETSSSITLQLRGQDAPPDITLYAAGDDILFIRAMGVNLEYFRRTLA